MIISISTVTRECSVYALNGNRESYICEEHADMVVALPMFAEKAMKSVEGNIESLIVSDGPGYFTGTRIGMSFAKGLAIGKMDIIHTVNSLDVLAYKAGRRGDISVLLKARKGVYHYRRFNNNGKSTNPLTEQMLVNESDILSHVHDSIVVGEGIKYLPEAIINSMQYENIFYPDAKQMYLMYQSEGMSR